jgi:hypothetical protein
MRRAKGRSKAVRLSRGAAGRGARAGRRGRRGAGCAVGRGAGGGGAPGWARGCGGRPVAVAFRWRRPRRALPAAAGSAGRRGLRPGALQHRFASTRAPPCWRLHGNRYYATVRVHSTAPTRASVQKPLPYDASRPLARVGVRECTETVVPTGGQGELRRHWGSRAARWWRRPRRALPAAAGCGRAPCNTGSRTLAHPPAGDCTETAITQRFASTRRHPPRRVCRNRCLMTLRVHSPGRGCASAQKPWFQRGRRGESRRHWGSGAAWRRGNAPAAASAGSDGRR